MFSRRKSAPQPAALRPVSPGFRLTFEIEVGGNCRLTAMAPDPEAMKKADALQADRIAWLEKDAQHPAEPESVRKAEDLAARMRAMVEEATTAAEVRSGNDWSAVTPASALRAHGMDRAIADIFTAVFFRGAPPVRLVGLD